MRACNNSLLALPWHKGSENGSKVQQHVGNSTVQVFREWGYAIIVCWHYNGTGIQRMGHATIVCWHYNGTGVQKIRVGNYNLLALQWHKGLENRGRQLQFVGTTILQEQTITVCCCLMKQQYSAIIILTEGSFLYKMWGFAVRG